LDGPACGDSGVFAETARADAGKGSQAEVASRWGSAHYVGKSGAEVAAAFSLIHFREKQPPAQVMRFEIQASEKVTIITSRLSLDGRLAFTGKSDGRTQFEPAEK
jgi:hypothetical protein